MLFRRSAVLLVCCSALSAATIYDLKTDWNDISNPNGVWAYRQDGSLLLHNDVSVCCPAGCGITAAWSPGPQRGAFLPLWAKATGDNTAAGFLAEDIIVHSVDDANGNSGAGEANVTWTAPMAGMLDISGGLWYAHAGFVRNNDFILTLNGAMLASGTISATNGRNRANPLTFIESGLSVAAGDVVQLQVQRNPGQPFGSFAGVNLTIAETPNGGAVPES